MDRGGALTCLCGQWLPRQSKRESLVRLIQTNHIDKNFSLEGRETKYLRRGEEGAGVKMWCELRDSSFPARE